MTKRTIRVCLVEDHRATREGLIKLLRYAPSLVCVGAFANAEQAVLEVPKLAPDVVLMDINLPGQSGIECVKKLKGLCPSAEFVMLTMYDSSQEIFDALKAGASGYLLKRAAPDELLSAIEHVQKGGSPMSMQIARKVVAYFHKTGMPSGGMEHLTPREEEILSLLAKGLAYKQIADRLGISVSTVHTHLNAIYRKLHVQSGTEAVIKFLGR